MSSTKKQNSQSHFTAPLETQKMGLLTWLKEPFSPFRLLTTNIFTIIFVTALALLSYELLIEESHEMLTHILETVFVALTLFIIIPPLIYFFSYRPLLLNMDQLRRTEKRLHLLVTALESAEDGIVITNDQGDIQWSNPAFARLSGLDPTAIHGQNLRRFEADQQTLEEQERRWQALLSGKAWKEELGIHHHNGDNRTKEQIVTPVRDENGAISHLIFLEKDITEQRALEKIAAILATASQTLNQSLDLNLVLKNLLDLLITCIPYDNVAVIFLHDDSQFIVRAYRGCQFEKRFQENNYLPLTAAQDNVHMRTLLADRESVLIPNTAVHPNWEPFIEGVNSLAWLAVPIIIENEVIGFCVLNKNQPDSFTKQHLELTKALVSQASAAIQNARLFEQAQAGRERLQSLSRRLVELQEIERRYIARELHDEAGQTLTSLQIQLLLLEKQAHQPEAIMTGVAQIKQTVDKIAENLHRLATNLRPASLDHVGLLTALSQHVETLSSQHHFIGQFEAIGLEKRLPPDVETAVYRIVQEALTNVIRHAQATRVDVILKQSPVNLLIIVEDNGVGFDPSAVINNGVGKDHLGLIGIRERAEMLGGALIVESSLGNGSTLKIEVPHGNSHPHS